MCVDIYFEANFITTKNNFFRQHTIEFVNWLGLKYQKYQTNGTKRYENGKIKFLFFMKGLLSFEADCKSIFYMSNRSSKDNIDENCVPQF